MNTDRPIDLTTADLWGMIQEQRARLELLERHPKGKRRMGLRGRSLVAATGVGLALLLPTQVFASIPAPTGIISGCYASTGALSVVDSTATCPSGQTPLNWPSTRAILDTAHGGTGLVQPGAAGNVLTSDGTKWTSSGISQQNVPNGYVDLANSQQIAGTKTFTSCITVGTTTNSCGAPVDVEGSGYYQQKVASSNGAGTWLGLSNTSTGGTEWDLISTGSTNGEGPGRFLIHNSAGSNIAEAGSNYFKVNGTIQSTSGGIKFPDGTVQTSATPKLAYRSYDAGSVAEYDSATGTLPCPYSNQYAIGGGVDTGAPDTYVWASRPTDDGRGWRYAVTNTLDNSNDVRVWVICTVASETQTSS